MNNNLENFLKLVSDKPSDLISKLEWRQANQFWLDRSAAVAVKILSKLRFNRNANIKPGTQKELADLMNVSPQHINKIVRGEENLTIETITKIELTLKITIFEDSKKFDSIVNMPINSTKDKYESVGEEVIF
jgi:DNA-binding XRE family transcriptional regulator